MIMRPIADQPNSQTELRLVGGNTFGRNPKISSERTYNMFVSDGTLVQMPGYKKVIDTGNGQKGRGIFSSNRGNFLIAVIGNNVYKISGPENLLNYQLLFQIQTNTGDISIDENLAYQIAICDGASLWIYYWGPDPSKPKVTQATLPVNPDTGLTITPGYVTYHDGYFIVPDITSGDWYLSKPNDGTTWNWGAGSTYVFSTIQTKGTNAEAVLRAPGKGNLIYVFGVSVTELWNDVGTQLFPYQRNNSVSIDYGCISSNTIATMDEYVAFLGGNEKAGPVLLVSSGGPFERISTDGIDFKLGELKAPQTSYGFFFKIAGHVFYQITFYDPRDNYSLVYDFNSKLFSYMTDENMNYHISESVGFYNNTYYFVSINDGCIYQMDSEFYTYDYTNPSMGSIPNIHMIPCDRITNTVQQADSSLFIATSVSFIMEQGVDPNYQSSPFRLITTEGGTVITQEIEPGYVGQYLQTEKVLPEYLPMVNLTISKDGGATFGNTYSKELNPLGKRKNRVVFYGMGAANTLTFRFSFRTLYRKTISDGIIDVRERPD
jgi:hypothetical protein